MKLPLRGIIPPIVTPLIDDNTLDLPGLKNLVEHLIEGGVHGIFLLGTTGEATSLSYDLRKEFIAEACKMIDKRIPVLVGITDTSVAGSLDIAHAAKEAGADALVLSAPYYLPISDSEMISYLEDLAPKLPLPFMLYNMPGCTKVHMSLEVVKKGKELGAIGIKDSSGNMNYLFSLLQEFKKNPEFSIIIGAEVFLPETILYGGHGAVAGGANMFPKLFVELYEASVRKDMAKIAELRQRVVCIGNLIYEVGKDASKHIKTTKAALSILGICSGYVARPFTPFGEAEMRLLESNLKKLDC